MFSHMISYQFNTITFKCFLTVETLAFGHHKVPIHLCSVQNTIQGKENRSIDIKYIMAKAQLFPLGNKGEPDEELPTSSMLFTHLSV